MQTVPNARFKVIPYTSVKMLAHHSLYQSQKLEIVLNPKIVLLPQPENQKAAMATAKVQADSKGLLVGSPIRAPLPCEAGSVPFSKPKA